MKQFFHQTEISRYQDQIPYNPLTGSMARVNDPSTFTDFGTAMKAYALGGWDGIGYRVSEGIGAIDIDHCIREDRSLNDVAASIMAFFTWISSKVRLLMPQ